MRKCTLHIGPPKCGTSTIWSGLNRRDRLLVESDVFVPAAGRAKNGSHSRLAYALAGMSARPEHATCERDFLQEIAEHPNGQIVIACEQLWHLMSDPDISVRIISKLKGLDLDVSLAMHPRHQPHLVNTLHIHGLRSFSHGMSFGQYVGWATHVTDKFRYERWLGIANTLKVGIVAQPFRDGASRRDFFRDFLKLIGAPVGAGEYAWVEEPSLGPFAVDITRHLLRLAGGPPALSREQWVTLSRSMQKEIKSLGVVDPTYCGLSPDSSRQIENVFKVENDRFARALWGGFWDEAFAGATGLDFVCNDYEIVGIPDERRDDHRSVLGTLEKKLNMVNQNSLLPDDGTREALPIDRETPDPVRKNAEEAEEVPARTQQPQSGAIWRLTPLSPKATGVWGLDPGKAARSLARKINQNKPHPFGAPRLIPLHFKGFPLVLMYSQKSGCTSIVKWFLFQIGKLEEAMRFSTWVHDYRIQSLLSSPDYRKEAVRLVKSRELPLLKLVRDPYERAISSFLHTVELSRKKTRGPWEHALIVEARTRAGKPTGEIPSLSFLDFMRHVASVGATHDKINGHVAQQFVPIEDHVTPGIIKLEQFAEAIQKLESEFGLKRSPLTTISQSSHHKRSEVAIEPSDAGSAAETDITDLMIAEQKVPTRSAFYNEETRHLVRTVYARDFKAYGYET